MMIIPPEPKGSGRDPHQYWEDTFLSVESHPFYELVFDALMEYLPSAENALVLDAGCGTCAHALRLARRGFKVHGMDRAATVIETAQARVRRSAHGERIHLLRGDLTSLPVKDQSYSCVICWAVLMHVPDLDAAVTELARVVAPGGTLVLAENNLYSLQTLLIRTPARWLGIERARTCKTSDGVEYWTESREGQVLSRESRMSRLIQRFEDRGFAVLRRLPRQFTEAYAVIPSAWLRSLIHALNRAWFRRIGLARLAYGNILILRKQEA